MNTANWVPDLFMKRVEAGWRPGPCFSPDETPDLHDLYGKAKFEEAYEGYEAKAESRRNESVPQVRATRSLAQDADHAVRDRAPVDHLQGPVQPPLAATACRRRSLSNLCTEITLNTSKDEPPSAISAPSTSLNHLRGTASTTTS
jgi:ribonucleoside-diphosphate reductase alpha chain